MRRETRTATGKERRNRPKAELKMRRRERKMLLISNGEMGWTARRKNSNVERKHAVVRFKSEEHAERAEMKRK